MTDRHISWETLQQLIKSGSPIRIGIEGKPPLQIMMESGSSALSLLIPASSVENLPVTILAAIIVEQIMVEEKPYVRLTTRQRPLYKEFYSLLTQIADSIQLDKAPADSAIATVLENWHQLLREVSILSTDQQVGLMGELWLLMRLISVSGPSAIDSWTGPLREPHDFRFGEVEVEVKSTRGKARNHVINGLEQLKPSEGLTLYLLSLQFEQANTGDITTLPAMVRETRTRLTPLHSSALSFNKLIADCWGYREDDELHYATKYRMRSKPLLVKIDAACPALTLEAIGTAVGPEALHRIGDVQYTLNVEGLGSLDGTKQFTDIVPSEAE
jgi:hypothetical protein